MEPLEILKKGAQELGVQLNNYQLEMYLNYLDELVEWNKHFRLVGSAKPEVIVVNHFLDSLTCFKSRLIQSEKSVVDIGTGAGFPGLVLKIAEPILKLTLLDSSNKKIAFLQHLVGILGLTETEIIYSRAETFGQGEKRETYDLALARAVAPFSVLLEYALPLLKVGGSFIAQKSRAVLGELEHSKKVIELLGGELKGVIPVEVPFLSAERLLVIVDKVSPTNQKYPRREGIPQKRPL